MSPYVGYEAIEAANIFVDLRFASKISFEILVARSIFTCVDIPSHDSRTASFYEAVPSESGPIKYSRPTLEPAFVRFSVREFWHTYVSASRGTLHQYSVLRKQ
jgi:hypothetical protein